MSTENCNVLCILLLNVNCNDGWNEVHLCSVECWGTWISFSLSLWISLLIFSPKVKLSAMTKSMPCSTYRYVKGKVGESLCVCLDAGVLPRLLSGLLGLLADNAVMTSEAIDLLQVLLIWQKSFKTFSWIIPPKKKTKKKQRNKYLKKRWEKNNFLQLW